MTEPKRLDAADIAAHAKLVDIATLRLSAELADHSTGSAEAPTVAVTPMFQLQVVQPNDRASFQLRFRILLTLKQGDLDITVAALYDVPGADPTALVPMAIVEFANQDGLATLMPFIRQEVLDLSTRVLRTRVLLPAFRPGNLTFSTTPTR
ncbi:MAG: hypothetical protein LBM66_04900 [Bifidobacteriaceae bacterium]|jgi:hypothetical protein|nr:hypothetical protein [Bifidobacteriaceae bacterium]